MTEHEALQSRYQAWHNKERGLFAQKRCEALLRLLLSGWPRRSRSMLVMNAGSGLFIETLHDSGFDITCHDQEQASLNEARARLGQRCEYVLSAPDHLPFDDCDFDYVVAAGAMEFWENPEAVIAEMDRLACGGFALLFPNAWSLFGLECRLRKHDPLCAAVRRNLQSPRRVFFLLREIMGKGRAAWISVLPAPSVCWRPWKWLYILNAPHIPVPCGAFVGVRVDFSPPTAGTPLLLRTNETVISAK